MNAFLFGLFFDGIVAQSTPPNSKQVSVCFQTENWRKIPFPPKNNICSQAMLCPGAHVSVLKGVHDIATGETWQKSYSRACFSFDSHERISTLRPQHLQLSDFFTPCTSSKAAWPSSGRIWHRRILEKMNERNTPWGCKQLRKKTLLQSGLISVWRISSNMLH